MENNLVYQSEDGSLKLDVKLDKETVWLTQEQITLLFGKSKSTINEHINNIFKDEELDENSVVRSFRITANDDKIYNVKHYNLDMILSVGYRVNSKSAIKFRQWATKTLREYIIKGFVLDDDRLKQDKNTDIKELIERIRDIRASEKNFYQKIRLLKIRQFP